MFKKFSVTALIMVLSTGLFLETAVAQGTNAEAVKARANVAKIGDGANAKVEVKLKDQTKVKGHISAVNSDSFTMVDRVTRSSHTFSYDEVAEVKKPGGGLSTKSWIIIGSAVGGAIATWVIVKPALCDGGAQSRGLC